MGIDTKPAIQSTTIQSGVTEIGNGLIQIIGNAFGISQAVAIVNGVVSIVTGLMTIRARLKTTKETATTISGILKTPETESDV